MSYFVAKRETNTDLTGSYFSYVLLNSKNGCTNGCVCGISSYSCLEYPKFDMHNDQEGFIVLSGEGYAKVGEEEGMLRPGVSFIVPANTLHAIRSIHTDIPVEVFWFHAAI